MTLWGGRFEDPPSEATMSYTADQSDRRLLIHDIRGSIAHAAMLGTTGTIDADESKALVDALKRVLEEASESRFAFLDSDEDVHSAVERRLGELIGDLAGKLHSGRSRNDQIALDLRLYLREAGKERAGQLRSLAGTLAEIAEDHAETVVASYTHLQQAQPTTLGHHLLSFAWPALRSADRFAEAVRRIDHSPLGAGASVGTSLPIDPEEVSHRLGMAGIMANSIDAVGSRDFVSDYIFCCTQAMVDLSRLAETLVLWATEEFGWLRLSDAVSTGSSALPHKRNPDIAELVRGRTATVIGDMAAILVLQKGLASSYHRDLQEDKMIVFHADDALQASLGAMGAFLQGMWFDPPGPGPSTAALDLAEVLVKRGVPFRQAHEAVGRLLSRLEERGSGLGDLTAGDLLEANPRFEDADLDLLDPLHSARARTAPGAGSPQSVREQVAVIRRLVTEAGHTERA
ncbi:MAG: argininosuccinate lyase [Acidimicrobiia bacterium]